MRRVVINYGKVLVFCCPVFFLAPTPSSARPQRPRPASQGVCLTSRNTALVPLPAPAPGQAKRRRATAQPEETEEEERGECEGPRKMRWLSMHGGYRLKPTTITAQGAWHRENGVMDVVIGE